MEATQKMTDTTIPSPRQVLARKTVLTDIKGRTWVVWDLWESGRGFDVEFLKIENGKPTFETQPWPLVYSSIMSRKMWAVK